MSYNDIYIQNEILEYTFSYLCINDMLTVQATCRTFSDIIHSMINERCRTVLLNCDSAMQTYKEAAINKIEDGSLRRIVRSGIGNGLDCILEEESTEIDIRCELLNIANFRGCHVRKARSVFFDELSTVDKRSFRALSELTKRLALLILNRDDCIISEDAIEKIYEDNHVACVPLVLIGVMDWRAKTGKYDEIHMKIMEKEIMKLKEEKKFQFVCVDSHSSEYALKFMSNVFMLCSWFYYKCEFTDIIEYAEKVIEKIMPSDSHDNLFCFLILRKIKWMLKESMKKCGFGGMDLACSNHRKRKHDVISDESESESEEDITKKIKL